LPHPLPHKVRQTHPNLYPYGTRQSLSSVGTIDRPGVGCLPETAVYPVAIERSQPTVSPGVEPGNRTQFATDSSNARTGSGSTRTRTRFGCFQQVGVCWVTDELPSISEIAAALIEACDSLNFHNIEALDRQERKALLEALPFLRTAIDQLETITPTPKQ
jgi:hypothetical protein